MLHFEAADVVAATAGSILNVLTDTSNFEVWDSGMTHRSGEVRDGSRITVGGRLGGRRCSFAVQLTPDRAMSWTQASPFGLFRATRTWTLTPATKGTQLLVTDHFHGPLTGLLRRQVPLSDAAGKLEQYLQAVKTRAELLERSVPVRG